MQEIQVWGFGEPDDVLPSQSRGVVRRPASPGTLAAIQDPSLDYAYTQTLNGDRAYSPPYVMTPEERQAHDEQQAEMVRRMRLGLPSPEYVPKPGDYGTETWSSNDFRMYTRDKKGKLKFWGVREDDETWDDFWAKHDPEDTRHQEPTEEIEPHSPLEQNEKALEATPHREKSPVKRRQSRRTPGTITSHRVKKPAVPSSSAHKSTRRPLGSSKDTRLQQNLDEIQRGELKASSRLIHRRGHPAKTTALHDTPGRKRGRPKKEASQSKPAIESGVGSRGPKTAPKAPLSFSRRAAKTVEDSTSPKRRRGRPPVKAKSTPNKKGEKKQKTPVVQGNARVTKQKKSAKPSAAPSVHNMQTRARGGAEKIQVT